MLLPNEQWKHRRMIRVHLHVVVALQVQGLGPQRSSCHTVLQLDHLQLHHPQLHHLQLHHLQLYHLQLNYLIQLDHQLEAGMHKTPSEPFLTSKH